MSSGDDELERRPELLLKHLAIYGVTVRAIAAQVFCENSASKTENLFGRLLKQKRIVAYSLSKQPRLSYYTLSASEAARLSVQVPKGRLTGRAIDEALAVLYYCHGGIARRLRVSAQRVQNRLPMPVTASAPFVVQGAGTDAADEFFVARIIVPGREARPNYAVKIINEESVRLQRFPAAREWLSLGNYRFVVLVFSEPRRDLFSETIKHAKLRERIRDDVRVDVEWVTNPLATRPKQKEIKP